MIRSVALFSLLLVSTAPALAIGRPSTGITAAVTGGTLGIGPEIGFKLNPFIGVRGSATFLGFGVNGSISDYRYDAKVRLRNYGGTVDLYPFTSGFRVSGGFRVTSDNRVRFTGRARTNQSYGGITFTPEQAGTLSGVIETRDVSPLVTLGYSHSGLTGFTYGLDAGVMFHGKPQVNDIVATGQLGSNPLARDELNRQISRLRDEADNYPYYPVVQLHLGFRF